LRCSEEKYSRILDEAVLHLESGGVIAFPTETYYGLGVDPFNESAVERLFTIKGRNRDKPILLLVENCALLSMLISSIPEPYIPLMEKYWPGPLTLIFPAGKQVNKLLTGGTGSIGIRVSSNPVVQCLLRRWHKPVTATSANISGAAPAAKADDVTRTFGGNVDYVIDGGQTPAGLCSTVVGYDQGQLTLIRRGRIPFEEIAG
jgi:L-threonylcarbamoyladenylate synthase